jgi:hypothetical protein
MSPEPSVELLSETTTSPVMPFCSSAVRARVTHSSIVSASFRQGITTETVRSRLVMSCGRTPVCSTVLMS